MRTRSVLILFFGAIVVFVSFGLGVHFGARQSRTTPASLTDLVSIFQSKADRSSVRTLEDVWTAIHERYIQPDLNDTVLVQGAIRGLVNGLGDPYSTYFDPAEAKDFAAEINGVFEGVGMEVGFKEKRLAVIAPLPDTPAARAGLQAGDIILQIDKQDTEGLSVDQAISKIRGPKGTKVTFLIRRDQNDPQEISVIRDTIMISTVTAKIVSVDPHTIGYIKISSFTEDTAVKIRQEVQKQLAASVDGFVLDLRNNPGGLLDSSVNVVSIFVSNSVVVSEIDQRGRKKELRTSGNPIVDDQPIVVLVNKGSASASEIVAGALQDLGRATIVGEQTFGKGSVQQLEELADGSTLKLTVAKWYTPKNRSISDQGITPDEVVTPAESGQTDPQLDRATTIISGLLK